MSFLLGKIMTEKRHRFKIWKCYDRVVAVGIFTFVEMNIIVAIVIK